MLKKILLVTGAVLLSGISLASAQTYADPPGSDFQSRGIIENEGYPAPSGYDVNGRYSAPDRHDYYSDPPNIRAQNPRLRGGRGFVR
jgi:hypothetical protein